MTKRWTVNELLDAAKSIRQVHNNPNKFLEHLEWASMIEQAAEDLESAELYRWIRQPHKVTFHEKSFYSTPWVIRMETHSGQPIISNCSGEDLDEAIKAAIVKEKTNDPN